MSVPSAIALSGHLLLGQPVMVKPSEAEKNLVQSTTAGAAGAAGAAALRKLYVGNLHFSITEDQLRQVSMAIYLEYLFIVESRLLLRFQTSVNFSVEVSIAQFCNICGIVAWTFFMPQFFF